ncbi:hypothetical protein ACIQ7Q_22295 [Streptomyces sp. NPDC096176]
MTTAHQRAACALTARAAVAAAVLTIAAIAATRPLGRRPRAPFHPRFEET